jgi:hypothetical protein
MRDQLNDELKPVLDACRSVVKFGDGEFSMKWLRSMGHNFHWTKLMRLVELG